MRRPRVACLCFVLARSLTMNREMRCADAACARQTSLVGVDRSSLAPLSPPFLCAAPVDAHQTRALQTIVPCNVACDEVCSVRKLEQVDCIPHRTQAHCCMRARQPHAIVLVRRSTHTERIACAYFRRPSTRGRSPCESVSPLRS